MTFFDDISAKFKLIPDVIGQTVKTIQAQAQNQQIQKQVKQTLPVKKQVEQPAPQPTFFKDVAEKFNVLPQYQLEKQPIIKAATLAGQEIKQKVGQPLVETVSKVPGLESLNATPEQKAATQEKYKEYSFSDLGKDVTNLGLNFTVNPLLRIGMTIKGQNDVGPGLGFKDTKTYQQETIGSYPAIYGQYRKEGSNPVIAGLKTGITAAFDATLGAGLAKEFLPAARVAVRELPDPLLYKIQESKIPVDDIIGSISGAGGTKGTKEADAFVSSLDNKERTALYRTAQAYSKSGIPAVSNITKEPTALGEFAGLQKTEGMPITEPSAQLPGYRREPGQAPAMGLSTREVENVGYGPDKGKADAILTKHGVEKTEQKNETIDKFLQKNNPIPETGFISRQQQEEWNIKNDELRREYAGDKLTTLDEIKNFAEGLKKQGTINYEGKEYHVGGVGTKKDLSGKLKDTWLDLTSSKIGQKDIRLDVNQISDLSKKIEKPELSPENIKIADEFVKGDTVSYNGENYKFVKNYGVNGDRRLIEDSYGRQTPVLPGQIKKVSDAEGVSAYGMSHRPTETGATADDISKGGIIPSDFYDHPEWYANMGDKNYKESFSVLESVKGNPDAEITIYRASPKKELNNGDWITLSKGYAKQESLSENTPVHSFKVKAGDIQFAGDDINEFGYYPKETKIIKEHLANDIISNENQSLAQNPKNFKSADDYVKAQGTPVYHGTKHDFENFDPSKLGQVTGSKSARVGFYFTDNFNTAKGYANFGDSALADSLKVAADKLETIARKTNTNENWNKYYDSYAKYEQEALNTVDTSKRKVIEARVKLNKPLVVDYKGKRFIDEKNEAAINKAMEKGYDGVIFKNVADNVETTYTLDYTPDKSDLSNITVPFDVKSIKTKSQLIEEWNKANKNIEPETIKEKSTKISLKPNTRINQQQLDELKNEVDGLKYTIESDPARKLAKYQNKNGVLSEVLGRSHYDPDKDKLLTEWQIRGDDIAMSLGYETSEEAREAYERYTKMRDELPQLKEALQSAKADKELTYSNEQTDQINKILSDSADYNDELEHFKYMEKRGKEMVKGLLKQAEESQEKLVTKPEKSLLKLRVQSEARGAKIGAKATRLTIRLRRNEIKGIAERYGLSGNELNHIIKNKNLATMNSVEFNDFKKYVDEQGQKAEKRRIASNELQYTIQQKDLKKVENYQKALELPNISKMTTEELKKFNDLLQPFEEGDEFLSPRKLEMIDRTDLSGAKTIREARMKLAGKLGVDSNELAKINVGEFDRFKWDTSLAEANPFYKVMVEGFDSAILEGDARFLAIQKKTDELVSKARKGKGLFKTIGTKIAPTDDKIFNYLESTDKAEAAKGMTPAELEAAEFMRSELNKALEYEYEMQVLKKSGYEDSYITHIRRGFFEALKEGEIKKAFTELFDQYKQDEAVLTIMDQKTDQIIPLEKFFKFAMHRSGNIEPTKNVAKAFTTYMRIFERKKALDKIIPEVMTYVDVLTPQEMTSRGLVKDDKLKSFVTEYLNTKKGRAARMFVKPGGKADVVLRAVKGFTTILDLSLNIPVQLGSQGGVHMGLYTVMGTKRYAIGVARLATPRGRNFVKQYENYTGRTPWAELHEASKGLPEKAYETMFALFKDATVRGNKIHILGSLTPEEWSNGKVSTARLAEMKTELGRFLPVEGSKSILGSTTEGGMATQYKTWAIPVLRTTTKDLGELAKMLKNRENPLKSREFWELFRLAVGGSFVALVAYSVGNESSLSQQSQAGKPFSERVINKLTNDAFSMVSAIDPQTYTSVPRTLTFVTNLMTALSDLVRMNEYTTAGKGYEAGDLKGVKKIENLITPVMIKNILPTKASKTSNPAADILKKYKADTTSTKAADILKKYNL